MVGRNRYKSFREKVNFDQSPKEITKAKLQGKWGIHRQVHRQAPTSRDKSGQAQNHIFRYWSHQAHRKK